MLHLRAIYAIKCTCFPLYFLVVCICKFWVCVWVCCKNIVTCLLTYFREWLKENFLQQQIFGAAIFRGDTFVYTIPSPRAVEIYKMIIRHSTRHARILLNFPWKFRLASKYELFCNRRFWGASNKSKIMLFYSFCICESTLYVCVFMSIVMLTAKTIMLCRNKNSICTEARMSQGVFVRAQG